MDASDVALILVITAGVVSGILLVTNIMIKHNDADNFTTVLEITYGVKIITNGEIDSPSVILTVTKTEFADYVKNNNIKNVYRDDINLYAFNNDYSIANKYTPMGFLD